MIVWKLLSLLPLAESSTNVLEVRSFTESSVVIFILRTLEWTGTQESAKAAPFWSKTSYVRFANRVILDSYSEVKFEKCWLYVSLRVFKTTGYAVT